MPLVWVFHTNNMRWPKDGSLTDWCSHSHDDAVARILDEVHNLPVMEAVDIDVVDGEDAIADVEAPTTLSRRALDDATDGGASPTHT